MSPAELMKLRESMGLTQDDLAKYLGLRHRSQVSQLEKGRTAIDGPVLRLLQILIDSEGRILKGKEAWARWQNDAR